MEADLLLVQHLNAKKRLHFMQTKHEHMDMHHITFI